MRARVAWLVGALLAGLPGAAWGEDAGRDYLRTLERFEQGRGVSLERVFDAGRAAARELSGAGPGARMPASVVPRGLGIRLGEESLLVGPDPRFFLDLARRRGTAVDEEFFTLLRDTYHADGVTRRYTVPRSDVSVCHVFDHPDLESLYRNWTRFWATHPRAYADAVDREVKALEDMVAQSTCACGDRESVEAGLERFLKSFPRSPVERQVRARLERLRAGTSDFRFRCPTG